MPQFEARLLWSTKCWIMTANRNISSQVLARSCRANWYAKDGKLQHLTSSPSPALVQSWLKNWELILSSYHVMSASTMSWQMHFPKYLKNGVKLTLSAQMPESLTRVPSWYSSIEARQSKYGSKHCPTYVQTTNWNAQGFPRSLIWPPQTSALRQLYTEPSFRSISWDRIQFRAASLLQHLV